MCLFDENKCSLHANGPPFGQSLVDPLQMLLQRFHVDRLTIAVRDLIGRLRLQVLEELPVTLHLHLHLRGLTLNILPIKQGRFPGRGNLSVQVFDHS